MCYQHGAELLDLLQEKYYRPSLVRKHSAVPLRSSACPCFLLYPLQLPVDKEDSYHYQLSQSRPTPAAPAGAKSTPGSLSGTAASAATGCVFPRHARERLSSAGQLALLVTAPLLVCVYSLHKQERSNTSFLLQRGNSRDFTDPRLSLY